MRFMLYVLRCVVYVFKSAGYVVRFTFDILCSVFYFVRLQYGVLCYVVDLLRSLLYVLRCACELLRSCFYVLYSTSIVVRSVVDVLCYLLYGLRYLFDVLRCFLYALRSACNRNAQPHRQQLPVWRCCSQQDRGVGGEVLLQPGLPKDIPRRWIRPFASLRIPYFQLSYANMAKFVWLLNAFILNAIVIHFVKHFLLFYIIEKNIKEI